MKASIYEKLREEGYDVHRCAPGSDGNCYYLISERRDWDYGDKDGRIFKAVRETPTGDLEFRATLAFFVSRSAQATAKIKGLMGDFESFVKNAGVARLRELLKGDLSSTPHQDIVSSSNRIVRGGQTPPSYHAKNRYLKILARGGEVTDDERDRFLCIGGDKNGDKPEHVVFKFSAGGPTRALKAAPFVAVTGSSSGRGGGYG